MPRFSQKIHTVAFRFFLALLLLQLAAIALAIIGLFINAFMDARAGRAFEQVQMGATRQQVEAALGKPSRVGPCGQNLWWGNDSDYRGKNDGRCVAEARYEYFLSAWGIGYSQGGHVTSKYHYVSE
jgi:hypothetical protein